MDALKKSYSKLTVFVLWFLVAFPMGIFRFLLMPQLVKNPTIHPGIIYWILMVIGMIWQFFLSLIVLKLELGKFSWKKIKERLWLNHPRKKNGTTFKKAYWLVIPFILYGAFFEQTSLFSFIEERIYHLFPALAPPDYIQIQNLISPEFSGAWPLMILALISCLFNYLLGEELFFRGILLPKMNKAFGRWDWVINAFLFSAYHIHKISEVPLFLVGSIFIAYLNKKYRSFWPSIIIHGIEGLPVIFMVAWVIWFM